MLKRDDYTKPADIFRYVARVKKKNEDETFKVEFTKNPNMPNPMDLLARLFVMLNKPFLISRCREYICSLLHSIAELIDPAIVDVLQDNLPPLGKTSDITRRRGN